MCTRTQHLGRASTAAHARPSSPALAALAALAAIAPACGDNDPDYEIQTVFDPCAPLVVVPEAGSSPDEMDAVAAGISMWNARAGSRLTLEDIPEAPRVPVLFESASAPFYGFYDDVEGVIYVNEDLRGRARVVLIAHELGHALGLLHVDDAQRPSVMNDGNLKVAPNAGDAAALAALWGACPPSPVP